MNTAKGRNGMALLKCPECGREVSSEADHCPNCGYPVIKMKDLASKSDSGSGDGESVVEGNPSKPDEKENTLAQNDSTSEPNNTDQADKGQSVIVDDKKNNSAETPKKKKNKKTVGIVIGIIAAAVVIGIIAYFSTANLRAYNNADNAYTSGDYNTALTVFTQLGDYKDSANRAKECIYKIAIQEYEAEDFQKALEDFKSISDYKDASDQAADCEYQLSTDGQFFRALRKGLYERWDDSEKNNQQVEDPMVYAKYCDMELEQVSDFYDLDFDADGLKEKVDAYIDALNKAKDATDYYNVNYVKYSDQWAEAYSERTILLKDFVNNYGFTVDDAHQATLDDLLKDAAGAEKENQFKTEVETIKESISVSATADEWGYYSYTISLTNTTNYTFEYFYVNINVTDGNGKIISTGSSDSLNNWEPGQNAEVSAWFDGDSDTNIIEGNNLTYSFSYQSGNYYA